MKRYDTEQAKSTGSAPLENWVERQLKWLRAHSDDPLTPVRVRGILGRGDRWLRGHPEFFPHTDRIHTGKGTTGDERRYDPQDVIAYLEYLAAHQRRPQTAREIANQARAE